jgi:predicted dehydrogenase
MPRPRTRRSSVDRRTFLFGALAAGVATAQPFWARPALFSPNGKLRLAAVGVGGMGREDLLHLVKHPMLEIAALCDVDRNLLAEAKTALGGLPSFTDYRELFAGDVSKFDAVLCATPDHNHAPVVLRALRAKKHVYGQKPLTRTVSEARVVREAAAKNGVTTQMGIQRQATAGRRLAAAIMEAGVVGKVKEVHVWTNRPAGWWPQGGRRPEGADPAPAHLDWDSWLGVAPARSFKEKAYAPFFWRGVLDFGTGALGDMGCHFFDCVVETLGLGAPLTVRAEVKDLTDDQWPVSESVTYEFPGTKKTAGATLKLVWTDGGRVPTGSASPHLPKDFDGAKFHLDGGILFVGEEATLAVPCNGDPKIYPEEKAAACKIPDVVAGDHWGAWVDACLGKGKTAAGFDFSGPLTETVLLGAVASRASGVTLRWDAAACRITNHEAADALLRPKYRDGWAVDGLG